MLSEFCKRSHTSAVVGRIHHVRSLCITHFKHLCSSFQTHMRIGWFGQEWDGDDPFLGFDVTERRSHIIVINDVVQTELIHNQMQVVLVREVHYVNWSAGRVCYIVAS